VINIATLLTPQEDFAIRSRFSGSFPGEVFPALTRYGLDTPPRRQSNTVLSPVMTLTPVQQNHGKVVI
jgi:hypothetical protein